MKVIFLDIDGVLNHEEFYRSDRFQENVKKNERLSKNICPKSIENLNTLIEDTEAKVVVSSTWRIGETVENMQKILDEAGFKGEVIGLTPDLREYQCEHILRGNEIYRWMLDNCKLLGQCISVWEFKHYVILDDDSDMLLWQKDNYLQVDRFVGITMGTVLKAKKILNS